MNEQEYFQIFFFLFFTPHHILSFDRRVRNRISCLLLNNIYTCLKKILYFFISHEILWHGRTTRIINNNKYFDTHIFKKSWNLGRERRRKKFVESLGKSWRVKEHRRIIFKTLGNLAATFPGKSPRPIKERDCQIANDQILWLEQRDKETRSPSSPPRTRWQVWNRFRGIGE